MGNLASTVVCILTLGLGALACVDQPWDPKNDHADNEAQRFQPWTALIGLIRRLIA